MGEATKWLLSQGGWGVACLALITAVVYLWRDNKRLMERLETKSEKHATQNQETARQITEAFMVANKTRRERRNTKIGQGSGNE